MMKAYFLLNISMEIRIGVAAQLSNQGTGRRSGDADEKSPL